MQSSLTENELVELSKEGNLEAFSNLIDLYRQKVFQTCMGFLHSRDDADDLTQDIFIKAWKSLKSFDGRSTFSTWLYRIAVNSAINQVRKNKLRTYVGLNYVLTDATSTEENADNHLMRAEIRQEIKKAVGRLKINQRKAFVLFYYQELSIKEIATVMKISPKAAESLVFRARKNLQKYLSRN